MIRKVEYYHGVALARLVRASTGSAATLRVHDVCRSAYILDERIALYVKYSTNRLSPWRFMFSTPHQHEVAEMCDEFEHTFIVLVCGLDGIACLTGAEYGRVLNGEPRDGEWIKAARSPRQKYRITGSDDRRVCRIGDNEYPGKVYAVLSAA